MTIGLLAMVLFFKPMARTIVIVALVARRIRS